MIENYKFPAENIRSLNHEEDKWNKNIQIGKKSWANMQFHYRLPSPSTTLINSYYVSQNNFYTWRKKIIYVWWILTMAKTELLYPKNVGAYVGSNGFPIIRILGTQGNWKNENPRGNFGATS